jgi:hypothetical protein
MCHAPRTRLPRSQMRPRGVITVQRTPNSRENKISSCDCHASPCSVLVNGRRALRYKKSTSDSLNPTGLVFARSRNVANRLPTDICSSGQSSHRTKRMAVDMQKFHWRIIAPNRRQKRKPGSICNWGVNGPGQKIASHIDSLSVIGARVPTHEAPKDIEAHKSLLPSHNIGTITATNTDSDVICTRSRTDRI